MTSKGWALSNSRKAAYLSKIDKTGRPRFDLSPLWADVEAFDALLEDIETHFVGIKIDSIVCLDALGFVLGSALAQRMKKPLILLRKGGKLPLETDRKEIISFKDYDDATKSFELRKDLIHPNDAILLVDEWIGTGAQFKAAIEMLTKLNASIAGLAVVYCFPDEPYNLQVLAKEYNLFAANCLVCTYFECRCNE